MTKKFLFILSAAALVLMSCNKAETPAAQAVVAEGAEGCCQMFPIAYVNLDSLLVKYNFAIDANDRLMSKQEDARVKLNQRARTFQNEAADFQRKLDNNAFLSRERAESEAAKLQKKQDELQQLEAKLTQDLMVETQALNAQLADSLMAFLEVYNADGRYKMILTNTAKDNVLMAAPELDITDEVVEGLNARYSK